MTPSQRRRSNRLRRRPLSFNTSLLRASVLLSLTSLLFVPPNAGADGVHPLTQASAFAVGLERCTFVDHTRRVINYSTSPPSVLTTSRTLVTEVRYPTRRVPGEPVQQPGAPPVSLVGGYPTIVFAHGYDVTPDTYAALLDSWVEAGFVVVAPFFPDEKSSEVAAQHGVNTEGDLVNEPGDLAFVTKTVIQASTTPSTECPIVSGLVRGSEIALVGHSDGATAVGMLAYDHGVDPQGRTYASLRTGVHFRAVVVLSGDEDSAQSYRTEASRPNLLVVHSLADQCNPIHNGVKLYNAIRQPNKWFLELLTAHHLPPFDGTDASAFKVVVATSVRFLQISLEGMRFSTRFLAFANEQPTIARTYVGGLGRTLVSPPRLPENCGPN
ncbi:MAG TPA: hypothetical protein VND83_07315 [Acidimicrobiales bacterium]|nr:hypothetical protein [Acidimicrobiales bacterium]